MQILYKRDGYHVVVDKIERPLAPILRSVCARFIHKSTFVVNEMVLEHEQFNYPYSNESATSV